MTTPKKFDDGPTPGPWKRWPGANDANLIGDRDGRAVATVYSRSTTGYYLQDIAEAEANRALVEKAWLIPKMAEALRASLEAFELDAQGPLDQIKEVLAELGTEL